MFLQTLESEQLEFAFRAQGITLEDKARQFYTDLWALIKEAEKIHEPLDLAMCEHHLRKRCKAYFKTIEGWRHEEEEKNDHKPACMQSTLNKQAARAIIPLFERQFYRYALCYLELNRALVQNRARLSPFVRAFEERGAPPSVLKVNSATGPLLDRAHRERKTLMEKRLKLNAMKEILSPLDAPWAALEYALKRDYGDTVADQHLTRFKALLRKGAFDESQKTINLWPLSEARSNAQAILNTVFLHKDILQVQDSYALQQSDTHLMAAFLKNDEDRIIRFMEKFNVPYMVYQYKNLLHLAYLLGRVGTIESLIILHARLMALCARKEGHPETAKRLELTVLVPAKHLLDHEFRTLSALFSDMESITAILEKLLDQTRQYTASKPGA